MRQMIRGACAVVVAFSLVACGDDSTGSNGNGGNSFSASINGQAFSPPSVTVGGAYASNVLTIQGSTTSSPITAISINVTNVDGPGTYQLTPNFAGTFGQVVVTSGTTAQAWSTVVAPGTGSITITSLSSTKAVGTFSFTAQAGSGGATGQKAVTNGAFNVTF